MAELVGDQFADINGLGFELERRQGFRRENIADVGKHGSKPGEPDTVAKEQSNIDGPRCKLKRRHLLGSEGIAQIANERTPEGLRQAGGRKKVQRDFLTNRRLRIGIPGFGGIGVESH